MEYELRSHASSGTCNTSVSLANATKLLNPTHDDGKTGFEQKELALVSRQWSHLRRIGWWWEAGGVVLSLICTCFIVAILYRVNNKPQKQWTIPIKPNSQVAVFSTIAKSALLIPVAECLSQLKWLYFREPRTLNQFQAFDDASRGPWGATLLLWKTRSTAKLANVGAIIVIISLAYKPVAQQMLEFYTQHTPLTNVTGSVMQTASTLNLTISGPGSSYQELLTRLSAPYISRIVRSLFFLEAAGKINMFLDKISNPVLTPAISCPTSRCIVPPFGTMSTCRSCEQHIPQDITCQHTANGMLDHHSIEEFISIANSMELADQELVYKDWESNCTVTDPSGGISGMILVPNNQRQLRGFSIDTGAPIFQWKDDLTTIVKIIGYQPTSWPSTREEFELWNGFTGNITVCKIKYCVHRYDEPGTTEDGKYATRMPTETALEYDVHENADMSGSDFTFNAVGSKEQKYTIAFRSINAVSDQIFQFAHRMMMVDSPYNTLDSYLADIPWETLTLGLSSVATSIINSDQNMNSTKLDVTAYELEVYIRVRWLWFIVPLSTVLLATLFLILSIVRSKDEVKFKSSILVPLFHGLKHWQEEVVGERGVEDERLQSAAGLLRIADEMRVVLRRDDQGYLGFIR